MGTRIAETAATPVVAHASAVHFQLRVFLYNGSLHFYRKTELADPDVAFLKPWCQEDTLYPDHHPRIEVSAHEMPEQRTATWPQGPCRRCTALWDYANAHRGEFR
jgi:hypothetical protein